MGLPLRGASRAGRTPKRMAPRGCAQNGSFSVIFPRLLCSRALMRDFAVALLSRNRYDSLPVSTMWQ